MFRSGHEEDEEETQNVMCAFRLLKASPSVLRQVPIAVGARGRICRHHLAVELASVCAGRGDSLIVLSDLARTLDERHSVYLVTSLGKNAKSLESSLNVWVPLKRGHAWYLRSVGGQDSDASIVTLLLLDGCFPNTSKSRAF